MGGRHLTIEDRRELEKYYLDRISVESIAETLRVHRSTIYNELRRGDTGRVDKKPDCAERRFQSHSGSRSKSGCRSNSGGSNGEEV